MQIGDKLKDKINGFSGVAVGMTEYINGCRQFLLKPTKMGGEKKPVESMWIDEQHLEVEKTQVLPNPFRPPVTAARAGGPDSTTRRT